MTFFDLFFAFSFSLVLFGIGWWLIDQAMNEWRHSLARQVEADQVRVANTMLRWQEKTTVKGEKAHV